MYRTRTEVKLQSEDLIGMSVMKTECTVVVVQSCGKDKVLFVTVDKESWINLLSALSIRADFMAEKLTN